MIEYRIRLDDEEYRLDASRPLSDLFNVKEHAGFPLVAALFNNELYSLNSHPDMNGTVKGVYLNSATGLRLYRRTLCFILEMAARELFPSLRLFLSHSLGHSYYYHCANEFRLGEEELKQLKEKMVELVERRIAIQQDQISWREAVDYFESQGQHDTVLLLRSNNKARVRVNRASGYLALQHEILLPSTDLVRQFDIMLYADGFLLRYPPARDPLKLSRFKDEPLLFSIYSEYKTWGKILSADTAGKMNALVSQRGGAEHFIRVCESLHNKKIAQIADMVLSRRKDVKVILIAGPSSSGKTTFTKKLCIQLQVVGFNPVMVSLDDYYLPHDQVPVDEYGKLDFEALEALDVDLLNKNLLQLFSGEETEFPVFDFKKGGRLEKGRVLQMKERSILVMEGIHGLNKDLTPAIPAKQKFKVYISALTQMNLDDHTRIPTTDNRLIRRIVRDKQFRHYDAINTLRIWPSVRRGESRNIFPNQDQADAAFNSALDYELCVLRLYAEPLLRGISPDEEEYAEAQRLIRFIRNFSSIPPNLIPGDSILREFIGNSTFKY